MARCRFEAPDGSRCTIEGEGHGGYHNCGGVAVASRLATAAQDPVNHPAHYAAHPSGVECIVITEHMSFCLGNVFKYLWRAGHKGPALEDMKKARWYLDREITRLERTEKT